MTGVAVAVFSRDAACWFYQPPFLSGTTAREEQESLKKGETCTNLLCHGERRRHISQSWWQDPPLRAPAPSDIRYGQKATIWSYWPQCPDVVRCGQMFLLKLFLQKMQFNPKHWSWLLTKGVVWCHYLPASIHPIGIGIERAQNFINLQKKMGEMVKLSRGERHSESLLDNLNKAACVCKKWTVASCLADNQDCGTSLFCSNVT